MMPKYKNSFSVKKVIPTFDYILVKVPHEEYIKETTGGVLAYTGYEKEMSRREYRTLSTIGEVVKSNSDVFKPGVKVFFFKIDAIEINDFITETDADYVLLREPSVIFKIDVENE